MLLFNTSIFIGCMIAFLMILAYKEFIKRNPLYAYYPPNVVFFLLLTFIIFWPAMAISSFVRK